MTDAPKQPAPAGGAGTLDWADPSELPLEEVRDVFLTLSKALRAYQLYDPNNPVYKRFAQNLRESLLRVWAVKEQVQILVEEERFTWMGEEVYKNDNRTESLAFLFFRDGIRDLTLRKGLEEVELERFLDALHRAKNARREGDDLVTILWDLDFQLISYTAVDLGAEGADLSAGGQPANVLNATDILTAELGELAPETEESTEEGEESQDGKPQPQKAGTVKKEDFNPTLYALDPEEQRALTLEATKEMERDLRTEVLNALFDRLEDSEHAARQVEIVGILRTLLPNFLSHGSVVSAAFVIREIQAIRARRTVLSEEAERLADQLMEDLSAKEVVEELVRALEDGSLAPEAKELSELIRHLRPLALAPLLRGSEQAKDERIRKLLRDATQGIGQQNRDAVMRLLTSDDPAVACGAVRLAGRLGISDAGGALARLLEGGIPQVVQAVIETAEVIPSAPLAAALQRVLGSPDAARRIAAARVLGKTKYAPAAKEFRRILESKEFRAADVTEKVALFEAYGMLGGEPAVEFLDGILNTRGFLGRKEPADVRAGAALGLGKIGSPAARAALEKAKNQEEPVVRSAVGRALKGD